MTRHLVLSTFIHFNLHCLTVWIGVLRLLLWKEKDVLKQAQEPFCLRDIAMSSNTRSEPETAKSHFFNYVKKPFFLTMIFKDIAFFFWLFKTHWEAVGLQFEPYRGHPCDVTWDSSRTVVVIKLLQTSALSTGLNLIWSWLSLPSDKSHLFEWLFKKKAVWLFMPTLWCRSRSKWSIQISPNLTGFFQGNHLNQF